MTAEAFFLFMFSVILVAYTATSMALAISADQTVVAIANIFMTIACVFMMVMQMCCFEDLCPQNNDNIKMCVSHADLCGFVGESYLHRQLARLVKISKHTTIWPDCKFLYLRAYLLQVCCIKSAK